MSEQPTGFQRLAIHAIQILFGGDERLLQFFFHHKEPRLRSSANEMLEDASGFSHGEFLLIRTALDIWCGEGQAPLADLLSVLDDEKFLHVLQALAYKREMIEAWEALTCCE